MKTDPIYLLKPYEKEMSAQVVEVNNDSNETRVMLNKTVFYPMGGGQPTDQGKLILEDGSEIEVYQVLLKEGEIWHYLKNAAGITVGSKVKGEINWERRFKHMRLHTAGHVIDFALYTLGYTPVTLVPQKADHGKKPYIMYKGVLDQDIKDELQSKVDELISKALKFSWELMSLQDLEQKAIYLQPGLPSNKPLRALTLEGIGTVADGGTITSNTNEVEGITIENIDKDEGNTIISYSVKELTNEPKESKDKVQKVSNPKTDLSKYSMIDPHELEAQVSEAITSAPGEESLTNLWRKYLGKDGIVTSAFKDISKVESEDRKAYGQMLNELKDSIDYIIENAKSELKSGVDSKYHATSQGELSLDKPKIGHLHPLTQTINDFNEIFKRLGYSVMDGPEIETDEYNFVRTNLPADHPARDLQDSIYVEEPNILLRTQTSSIEARILETYEPPFKVVMPGRTFRNEKVNRTNHFTFHQYQLICVQEKVSMAELFATIEYLFKSYLGDDVVFRFRNKYYPEVEPGVGPDMRCFNCEGKGCPVCKNRGWIEMGGAGIRHPNMLKMAGIDPKKWQGYAFGLGLDRWAMAKYKITDIRTLLGGNLVYKPNVG